MAFSKSSLAAFAAVAMALAVVATTASAQRGQYKKLPGVIILHLVH